MEPPPKLMNFEAFSKNMFENRSLRTDTNSQYTQFKRQEGLNDIEMMIQLDQLKKLTID